VFLLEEGWQDAGALEEQDWLKSSPVVSEWNVFVGDYQLFYDLAFVCLLDRCPGLLYPLAAEICAIRRTPIHKCAGAQAGEYRERHRPTHTLPLFAMAGARFAMRKLR
jgi:hypothetical protein